jgi:acylphosphatase
MAEDPGSKRAISAVIRGRVQGVGYRFTTQRVGHSLGLAGWVRNESDGSVSVRAQGDRAVVSRFVDFLEQGPPAARVQDVAVREETMDPLLTGFTVRY